MERDCVAQVIEARGLKKSWVAERMAISPSYLSKLLTGEREWTDELKSRVADVLMVPRALLFFGDDRECN